ncbi:predicted protein [Micromonas commoda]|uniref:DNA damage-binding protein 1 n=1 Tax=Micromonas commoda (strain RCC299 / NOUM17 / CCMP2709) TaxID=296587 RepID=C1E9R7_MICCC|nr:predicted protein [Micromonas commoda]ACO65083.1 predicted protein [Micromonas commoda]|eukprot:XP_002503825.1 predicted protein [Micromonas commoda]
MAYNYVVTAQKPTSVTHSLVGNFTHDNELNLIVAKCTRIEIHMLTPDGLQPMHDVPVYGRIAVMKLYRPAGEKRQLLYVATERLMFCVLAYDQTSGAIATRAMGDLSNTIGRPCEHGLIGEVDPECRLIGSQAYDGLFKVVPMDRAGQLREAFDVRLEELNVVDVKFMHGCATPTICVLYEDTKEARHVKTYEVDVKEKTLRDGPWSQSDVEGGSSLIIPVPAPLGGAIVVGESVIVYLNKDGGNGAGGAIATKSVNVMAHGVVDADGSRYLLSDSTGMLHLLVLVHDRRRVHALKLESLGQTSIASTLSYLDNGVVYVGSAYGDSQLVRLHAQPVRCAADQVPATPDGLTYVECLESFTNLGPIVDFAVVDLDRHGQGQVVTCSGVNKDGSLRVVRNGVGIHERAAIELPGVKGCWSLRRGDASTHPSDTHLVVSFAGETRILAIDDDDELAECEFRGFSANEQTLCVCNVDGGFVVQCVASGVRLVNAADGEPRATWSPPGGATVSVASANRTQALVATTGGSLYSLALGSAALIRETASASLDGKEIACLDCTPLSDPGDAAARLCAVGTWTAEVFLLTMPDLRLVTTSPLGGGGGGVIPRAVLLCSFEGTPHLLAGLGDGALHTFGVDPEAGTLRDGKSLSLGTQPITLRTFRSKGATHVFAGSDRPTVIYGNNGKLIYSNVNLREVLHACPFNCDAFPDSLALASESDLTIGGIDDIQKLHIRTVPLGEQPRRIAHQPETRTYAALTENFDENGYFVRLFDDVTFETLCKFRLEPDEQDSSVISCAFADDPRVYYVVGTGYSLPEEPEPTRGRILVFRAEDGKLQLVAEKEVKGAVYNLNAFNGKLLAGINSKVELFRGGDPVGADGAGGSTYELAKECSHHGHIVALYVAVRGEFIVVGDLMKSVSLLAYKPEESVIEERARDYNANWMTAVDILDDDTYLGAENNFNLFTLRRQSDAATDEERSRLEVVGEYHVGEFVNRFRRGSLVMRLPDQENADVPTLLFGTVSGVIGVLATLPREQFEFLSALQAALNKTVSGVGGLSHDAWRSFQNEHRHRAKDGARGFVDGDLIESFLDLRPEKAREVAAAVKLSVDELTRRVEDLQRLTH